MRSLQSQFRILDSGIAYLDSAAKALTPDRVLEAMNRYYNECNSNAGRSLHRLARRATESIGDARNKISELISASPEEIIFTKNTTEAIGIVSYGLGLTKGDAVVTTLAEHHSNYLPWLRLQQMSGVEVITVRPRDDGYIDPVDIENVIAHGKTRLVTISHVSNALGTIEPVREICRTAREAGALSLIDGAQSVPHLEVDVNEIGCDFLAWSGHKMFGPTGTGALYCRAPLMNKLIPLHSGGGVIRDVNADSFSFSHDPPYKAHECGTPDIAGIIGFGEAADYLMELRGDPALCETTTSLAIRAADALSLIPDVHIAGPSDPALRSGIVSFWIDGISPHRTAAILDEEFNVLVRSGHHCALPLMKEVLKRPTGTVRASFHYYSDENDVNRLCDGVRSISRNSL